MVKCDEKMVDQSFSSSFSELLATARGKQNNKTIQLIHNMCFLGYFTWPDDVTLYRLPEGSTSNFLPLAIILTLFLDRELLPDKIQRLCFEVCISTNNY